MERNCESLASYTEATHTVYGPAPADADLISIASAGYPIRRERRFRPDRITIHYHWRTQLGHTCWVIGNIHISGPWVAEDGSSDEPGSGSLIHGMGDAPQWAKEIATTHFPAHIGLVFEDRKERPQPEGTVDVSAER